MALRLLGLAVPVATTGCVKGQESWLSGQSLVLPSTGQLQRGELGKTMHHGHAALSCSRRNAILRFGLPLAHGLVIGGAKALSSVVEVKPEAGGNEAETRVLVFGFDGLGKPSEEYVPGKVVALAQSGDGAVLFLGVDGFEMPLQLVMGPAEAMAVLAAIQDRKGRRPVTHEAWGSSISAVGWKVDRVAITSKESDDFCCRVIVSNPAETMKSIDVRPSDGIALALRCRAPLYVCRKLAEDILGPDLDQADSSKVDPLKRPSLQANNKSVYVDNYLAPATAENQSDLLLFIDGEVSELLGASAKIFI